MAIEYARSGHLPDQHQSDDGNPAESDDVASEQSDDGEDDESDTSSVLTEVRPDEYQTYFQERHGRLFSSNSHGGHYPLPVDTPEQERLEFQHNLLRLLLGGNYTGPVQEILAREHGRQKRALDLCTGAGTWVIEMAVEFPHVHFSGIDIVPIASRDPPRNVRFEMHNINEPLRWQSNTFEFVHARDMSMAACHIEGVLREVARVLRPGGLFLSCELGHYVSFYPGLDIDPRIVVPRACAFFDVLDEALQAQGILPVDSDLPACVAATGQFRQITALETYVPIGGWHRHPVMKRLGRQFRGFIIRYATSMMPVLLEWLSEGEAWDLVNGLVHDLSSHSGMVGVYHTVHARKV